MDYSYYRRTKYINEETRRQAFGFDLIEYDLKATIIYLLMSAGEVPLYITDDLPSEIALSTWKEVSNRLWQMMKEEKRNVKKLFNLAQENMSRKGAKRKSGDGVVAASLAAQSAQIAAIHVVANAVYGRGLGDESVKMMPDIQQAIIWKYVYRTLANMYEIHS
jgi:hypothetical protein